MNFWDDENFLFLDSVGGYIVYTFVRAHQIVHIKCLHFILCKLYLNKDDLKNTISDHNVVIINICQKDEWNKSFNTMKKYFWFRTKLPVATS